MDSKHIIKEILNNPSIDKHQAISLMVNIRKSLEYLPAQNLLKRMGVNFPTLKFYCDWALHDEKKIIPNGIKCIMEEINKAIPQDKNLIKNAMYDTQKVTGFIYMEKLKEEMEDFFKKFGHPIDLTQNNARWLIFINSLLEVLERHPIIRPLSGIIEKFEIVSAENGKVWWVINFNDQRGVLTFGNFM